MRYIIGRFWTRSEKRDEYLNLAARFIETSRAEDGCVYYDQGPIHGDPNGIVLVECSSLTSAARAEAVSLQGSNPVALAHPAVWQTRRRGPLLSP